jgi:hypothetical protein
VISTRIIPKRFFLILVLSYNSRKAQEQAMEINKVEDLIPYHQSLVELWKKEEFQPVLALYNSLAEETVQELRALNILELPSENAKSALASYKIRLNMIHFLLDLPAKVREAKNVIEFKQQQQRKMQAAAERSSI